MTYLGRMVTQKKERPTLFLRNIVSDSITEIEKLSAIIENCEDHINDLERQLKEKTEKCEAKEEECDQRIADMSETVSSYEVDAKAYRSKGYYAVAEELKKAQDRIKAMECNDEDAKLCLGGLAQLVRAMGLQCEGKVGPMLAVLSGAIQKHAPWAGGTCCGDEQKLARLLVRAVPFMNVAGRYPPNQCNSSLIDEIDAAIKDKT